MGLVFGIIGMVALLSIAGWCYEIFAEKRDRKLYPSPGKLIQINQHKLHLHCMGNHSQYPTIVLEAGMGNCSFDWRLIQPTVAQFGRVCSYDRAGFGWSETSHASRTFQQIVDELHTLLICAGETGPYILVGHSFGGILVREFARQYPDDVAGMVLIDSAHENQIHRLSTDEFKELKKSLGFYRILALLARVGFIRLLARPLLLKQFPSVRSQEEQDIFLMFLSRPEYFDTLCAESQALLQSTLESPNIPGLKQIPLAVIQATGRPPTLPRNYSEERWQSNRKMFDAIQRELTGLSSNSQLIQAEKSVHAVQLEQPEIVIAAIQQVANAISPAN